MIDPEFFVDSKLGELSIELRLLFIGTWIYADDEGYYQEDYKKMKVVLFPYDSKFDIEKGMQTLIDKGFIERYNEDNKFYHKVKNFNNYQKISHPTPSKISTILANSIVFESPQESSPQVNISKAKLSKAKLSKDKENDMLSFWNYYVLKIGKRLTLNDDRKKLILKKLEDFSLEDMKKVVDNFVADGWYISKNRVDLVYCIGVRKKVDNFEHWLNWKPTQKDFIDEKPVKLNF